jgi:hypothetical protein
LYTSLYTNHYSITTTITTLFSQYVKELSEFENLKMYQFDN